MTSDHYTNKDNKGDDHHIDGKEEESRSSFSSIPVAVAASTKGDDDSETDCIWKHFDVVMRGIVVQYRSNDGIYQVEWVVSSTSKVMGYVHEDRITASKLPLSVPFGVTCDDDDDDDSHSSPPPASF